MKRRIIITELFLLCFLAGCQSKKEIQVSIYDGSVETRLETTEGTSVKEALQEAEITIDAKDQVTPDVNEPVQDSDSITILRNATVTVYSDDKEKTVTLQGATVKEALADADISVGKNDLTDHKMEAYLTDGMSIHVIHRLNVTLKCDGKKQNVLTTAKTVSEFLKEQKIKVGKDDRISKKMADKLEENDAITVQRVTYKKKTVTESIPYVTQTRRNASLKKGTSKTIQEGVTGKKEITYKITYVDGKEESRKEIESKTIKEAKNQIVERGTKQEKKSRKTIVKKQKEVDCDGTIIWHYTYSDGTTKTVIE
jgi:uncharacterized protein YabE (DUF348 family)